LIERDSNPKIDHLPESLKQQSKQQWEQWHFLHYWTKRGGFAGAIISPSLASMKKSKTAVLTMSNDYFNAYISPVMVPLTSGVKMT